MEAGEELEHLKELLGVPRCQPGCQPLDRGRYRCCQPIGSSLRREEGERGWASGRIPGIASRLDSPLAIPDWHHLDHGRVGLKVREPPELGQKQAVGGASLPGDEAGAVAAEAGDPV